MYFWFKPNIDKIRHDLKNRNPKTIHCTKHEGYIAEELKRCRVEALFLEHKGPARISLGDLEDIFNATSSLKSRLTPLELFEMRVTLMTNFSYKWSGVHRS